MTIVDSHPVPEEHGGNGGGLLARFSSSLDNRYDAIPDALVWLKIRLVEYPVKTFERTALRKVFFGVDAT